MEAAVRYRNRYTGAVETEAVYGEAWLRWTYDTPLGRLALRALVKRRCFSKVYGWLMDRPRSARRIEPFIRKYELDTSEFIERPEEFRSFNEFFCRRLKPEARPIDPDEQALCFPADGRHLGFADADSANSVYVKGQRWDLPALLGGEAAAAPYRGASALISRLCPTDYHRFHAPASGTVAKRRPLAGPLRSVSPLALSRSAAPLWSNKRVVLEIDSPACGRYAFVAIGATCVGAVSVVPEPGARVAKGEELGCFAFGGSCVICLFPAGRAALEPDLLARPDEAPELYARMGERAGRAKRPPNQ